MYKKMYNELKEQFDTFLRHKKRCPKKCKYCREWYKETLKHTMKIKNNKIRRLLLQLWETLWLNNCKDFDIICIEFARRL